MCGRYAVTSVVHDLLPDLLGDLPGFDDDYNVAPSALVPIVRMRRRSRELVRASWGFIPAWAKDARARPQPINARIETVADNGMFRHAFATARCIVPALGYYEWTVTPGGKQPHFIREPGAALAMAGIVSAWADPSLPQDAPGRWRLSMAIITRDAHVAPGEVHDRMPACLTPDAYETWLDAGTPPIEALAVLDEASLRVAARLGHVEVDRAVNSVRNTGPRLIEPLEQR